MSPEEEVERMKALCKQVVNEKDPGKFSALLEELDTLLKTTEDRMKSQGAA
jgi:hypothetical protein